MSKKEKTLKGIKTPSRRKFFKVAAATGAAAAASVAMPNIAFGAPQTLKMQAACTFKVVAALAIEGIANVAAATALVAAAALKNLRLEGVLIPFCVLSFFDIFIPLIIIVNIIETHLLIGVFLNLN